MGEEDDDEDYDGETADIINPETQQPITDSEMMAWLVDSGRMMEGDEDFIQYSV